MALPATVVGNILNAAIALLQLRPKFIADILGFRGALATVTNSVRSCRAESGIICETGDWVVHLRYGRNHLVRTSGKRRATNNAPGFPVNPWRQQKQKTKNGGENKNRCHSKRF